MSLLSLYLGIIGGAMALLGLSLDRIDISLLGLGLLLLGVI